MKLKNKLIAYYAKYILGKTLVYSKDNRSVLTGQYVKVAKKPIFPSDLYKAGYWNTTSDY